MQDKIRRDTVDFAIDLGTSDSVIAYFNGKESKIIKNHSSGEESTPSAIYIDDLGEIHIGKIAKDAVINDPRNAVSEFKLNMGFPIPFLFEKANKKMFPEQLSSEILKDLKKSIYVETEENVEEIVITVPANSNPLKTKATKEAGELAGFKSIHLILEPVAAAIAYGIKSKKEDTGIWMIYDLGGGTFDVSLVKANGEEIEKLATSGEDNLGGKLFDWKIVDDYFTPKIIEDLDLKDFSRDNPKYLKVFSLLKNEAEKAKIALSECEEYEIKTKGLFNSCLTNDDSQNSYDSNDNTSLKSNDLNDNDSIKSNDLNDNYSIKSNDLNDNYSLKSYEFRYELTKSNLKEIMKPFIKNTFNHCYSILEDKNLSIDDVEKIILVGGSTLSTLIRDKLKSEFNRPLEYSINPLTVVAIGASIYAGTIKKQFKEPENHKFALILDYETIGFNDNIDIKGKVFSLDSKFSFLDHYIEIVDTKNNNLVKRLDLDMDGNFKLNLDVSEEYNEFLIKIYDGNGNLLEIDGKSTNSINYKKALNPGYPILSSSISLYLDENSSLIPKNYSNELSDFKSDIPTVMEYFKRFKSSYPIASKGEKLDLNRKELFSTTDSIKKGDEDSFIKLSFYSGELILANYNTFLGEIIINGNDIIDDLPEKSDIELNISIDKSNLINFEVFIPYLRQSFNNSFIFNDYTNYNNFLNNYDNLKEKYNETIKKYNNLRDIILNNDKKSLFKNKGIYDNLERVYENIEEIEEKEIISYLSILIDLAKCDQIAIYPSLEYLNYLDDVLDECEFFLNIANINI